MNIRCVLSLGLLLAVGCDKRDVDQPAEMGVDLGGSEMGVDLRSSEMGADMRAGPPACIFKNQLFPDESFAAGTSPRAVAAGDLNGDGKDDIVAVNYESSNLSVLLGDGYGCFSAARSYATSAKGNALVLGKFDSDAFLDVAVTHDSGQVSVLLGKGDGSLDTFKSYKSDESGSTDAVALALGDFNGDGKQDLAVATQTPARVNVLLGGGDGTFSKNLAASPWSTDLSVAPRVLAVADFDGSKKSDIAVVGGDGAAKVSLLVSRPASDGFDVKLMDVDNTLGRLWVVAADFDGDQSVDLVLGSGLGAFLKGDGRGGFTAAPLRFLIDGGSSVRAAAAGRFNDDEWLDLAVATTDRGGVSVLYGKGGGAFTAPHNIAVGGSPQSLAVGQLNGRADGFSDLVVANSYNLRVLLGDRDGAYARLPGPLTFDVGANVQPQGLAAGDLNGDGNADLVTVNVNANPNDVSLLLGDGKGAFSSARRIPCDKIKAGLAIALGNFNNDTALDIAVANEDGGVSVLLNQGSGTFGGCVSYPTSGKSIASLSPSLLVTRINNDAYDDLVVTNSTDQTMPGTISVLLGNGDGTFQVPKLITVGVKPSAVAAGLFDNGSLIDLAVANLGDGFISLLKGDGSGGFTRFPQTLNTFMRAPTAIYAAKLDGDANLDLVVVNAYNSDTLSVFFGLGGGDFKALVNLPRTGGRGIVSAVDLNGDGNIDLVATGDHSVSVLLGDGKGSFAPFQEYVAGLGAGSAGGEMAVADFNKDGRLDLAIISASQSTVNVLLNRSRP